MNRQPIGKVNSQFQKSRHTSSHSLIQQYHQEIPSQDRIKSHIMPEQERDLKGSAVINFKQNASRQPQRQQQKQYFQVRINKKLSGHDHCRSRSPHLNEKVQNMEISRRVKIEETFSNRSLSKNQKDQQKGRNIKKSNYEAKPLIERNREVEEIGFACDEEFDFKPEPRREKKISPRNILQRENSEKRQIKKMKDDRFGESDNKLLEDFEESIKTINDDGVIESVHYLDERQRAYEIDPCYIEKRQKQMGWKRRAVLIEWMIQLAFDEEFKMSRESVYMAINIVDNYFQSTQNLPISEFQLAGATALFIAGKMDLEQPISSRKFADGTKNRYTCKDIKEMEVKMLKTLSFNLNPLTLYMWANKIMQQWDIFVKSPKVDLSFYFHSRNPVFFKGNEIDDYKNFRQVMQILDCAMLDIQTLQYRPKIIVFSLLYLVLGKNLGEYQNINIINDFPRTSRFLVNNYSNFNTLMKLFVEESFGIQLQELLPSIQYMATYFTLPLTFEKPCIRREGDEEETEDEEYTVERINFEQYCSYQTFNPYMLGTVKNRYRGIYE